MVILKGIKTSPLTTTKKMEKKSASFGFKVITIYFINPSGKLKLSFNRTTKNIYLNHISIILSHKTCTYTLLDIPPIDNNKKDERKSAFLGFKVITITIYFIIPGGKLKLSFNRTTKNISQSYLNNSKS